MSALPPAAESVGPVLLCFDGSDDAAAAIVTAGRVLAPRDAVVLTVWEPMAMWEPYDPATLLSGPLERLAANALGLDEIMRDLAEEKLANGVERASQAGFTPRGHLARGKARRTICEVAEKLAAEVIVLGARGLGHVGGALLGSVSSSVSVHAKRPVLIVPRHSAAGAADPS